MNRQVFGMSPEQIEDRLGAHEVSICVVGIGRIGLPTAISFANSGLRTIGVDINENLVSRINRKDFPLKDEPGYEKIFLEVMNGQKLSATTSLEEGAASSDIILLSLPTPMDEDNVPDYTALRTVAGQLRELVQPGHIIIVESTIEPGFIENHMRQILDDNDRGIKSGRDFGLGVCPETANPGEIMKDFASLPRLVGSTDPNTTETIMKIYKHVFAVDLIRMPDCKTANAVKLTTNVFRDVNIAFVNELALMFEKLGIDTFTVLDAASRKYNFQAHYPGAGVGGPCLPVNSYQFLNSSGTIGKKLLRMVSVGREINEYMPYHVVELVKSALNEAGKRLDSSEILVMGVSYKPNVKDVQLSPAEVIIAELQKSGAKTRIFDPYFRDTTLYGIATESDLDGAVSDADATVIVTAHDEFRKLGTEFFASKMGSPILIDARGMIDPGMARKAGLIFRGLGRGQL